MEIEELVGLALGAAWRVPTAWRKMSVGDQLRALREDGGVSQRVVADSAEVDVSLVSRAEAGRDLRLSTLRRLYEGLGYGLIVLPVPTSEEAEELLREEAARRRERRLEGLSRARGWG